MAATARFASYLKGKAQSGTLRTFAISMSAAVIARLGLLALAIMLGRRFGPSDYGAFTFATGLALILAQLALIGWPTLTNRMVPELLRDRNWGALKGLQSTGDMVSVAMSVIAIVALIFLSGLFEDLGPSLLLAALLVFPFATAILRRQQLAAFRQPAIGLLFDQGFGALVAVLVLAIFGVGSIFEAVLIFAGGILLGNLVTTLLLRRLMPAECKHAKRTMHLRPWLALCLPMLVGMSAKLFMSKADVLMLAPLGGLYESGLYGAAFRITFLMTFPQVVLMAVVTPMISEAFAKNQISRVKQLTIASIGFAAVTSLPFALVMMVLPGPIMTLLFGQQFEPASVVLALLAIGQLVSCLAIPASSVLTMGGKEKAYGTLHLVCLALHVLANFAVIPVYGAVGAAGATAAIMTLLGLGQLVIVRSVLGRG